MVISARTSPAAAPARSTFAHGYLGRHKVREIRRWRRQVEQAAPPDLVGAPKQATQSPSSSQSQGLKRASSSPGGLRLRHMWQHFARMGLQVLFCSAGRTNSEEASDLEAPSLCEAWASSWQGDGLA